MAETLDARAIFRVLADHGVDYIVVGGLAVQAHGFRRGTVDLDIVPRPDLANLSRLEEAMGAMGVEVFGSTEPVITDYGRLHTHNVASTLGLPADYPALRERAVDIALGGVTLAVVGLDDLIRMKRAAGRDQDLADIRALAASDDDLAREAGEST